MNTRQSIQPSNQPAVLSLAFSSSRNRFIAALSTGLRCFRSDNCLTTYHPSLPKEGGIAIAEVLDDRYLAYVGGGRSPASSPNVVVFWDALLGVEVTRFDLHEPILGVRLAPKWMLVVLRDRTVVLEYQQLQPQAPPTPPADDNDNNNNNSDDDDNDHEQQQDGSFRAPNLIKAIHPTAPNTYALARLQTSILALPAPSTGQVQIINLASSTKRVLRAHNSPLRCLALSPDNTLLATASEPGTLLRVFDLRTLDQKAEVRRGMDHAIIYGLAFSDNNRWLACTSDKGTLHVFDLRPPQPPPTTSTDRHPYRRSQPPPPPTSTHSPVPSIRSSPLPPPHPTPQSTQGSIQEYYGLRSPPASASSHHKPSSSSSSSHHHSTSSTPPLSTLNTTLSALPFAPRLLKDTRSTTSCPFTIGSDPPHWQGQGGSANNPKGNYTWTVAPNGVRRRVKVPVRALPGEPSGKPPKGVVGFQPRGGDGRGGSDGEEGEGEVLWVLGGGSEALWEVFDLGRLSNGGGGDGWGVVRRGWRRFLTRQFVD